MAETTERTSTKDLALFGVIMSVPITFAGLLPWMLFVHHNWITGIVCLPLITIVAFVVGGRIGPAITQIKGVVALAALLGWLLGVAAGIGLIAFGIKFLADSTVCEPSQTVRCVAIRGGRVIGDSHEGAASQRFTNLMFALIPIIPGLSLLIAMGKVAAHRLKRRRCTT